MHNVTGEVAGVLRLLSLGATFAIKIISQMHIHQAFLLFADFVQFYGAL